MKPFDLLRSGLALSVLPTLTAVDASVAMSLAALGQMDSAEAVSRSWCRNVLRLAGVRLRVLGLESLDTTRTYVLVANHQSHLDVPSMVTAWPGPLRFVAKKSLRSIPFFGAGAESLGHVFVDRGNTDQARAALEVAVAPVRNEVSVLFFAEGTRSEDGELGPFKRGCVAFADAAGVPLLPAAVVGTRQALPKGSPIFRGGEVVVSFGEPVPEASDTSLSRAERAERLRDAVAEQMERARAAL